MNRRIAHALILALVAGPAHGGQANDLLMTKNPAARGEILGHAIRSAGQPCRSVVQILFKGTDRQLNGDYFAARCASGADYLVLIGNDGDMKSRVLSCRIARAMNIMCWKRF